MLQHEDPNSGNQKVGLFDESSLTHDDMMIRSWRRLEYMNFNTSMKLNCNIWNQYARYDLGVYGVNDRKRILFREVWQVWRMSMRYTTFAYSACISKSQPMSKVYLVHCYRSSVYNTSDSWWLEVTTSSTYVLSEWWNYKHDVKFGV